MVGIIVVTHGRLAEEMCKAAELIVGKLENIDAISISPDEDMDEAKSRVEKAIHRLNKGDGVLILTDLFGGTPSNISLAFLEEGRVEVLSGVNLPILLSVATGRENKPLDEVAEKALNSGRKNITLASQILNRKVTPLKQES